MNAVCPYCRSPVDPQGENGTACPGCGTPHHTDCFGENGGCTVFGCSSAPADEPKLSLSGGDLEASTDQGDRPPIEPGRRSPTPPPPRIGQVPEPAPVHQAIPFTGTSLLFGSSPTSTWMHPQRAPEAAPVSVDEDSAKKRMTFITLGVLLGYFGAHNFYAGYRGRWIAQLLITVLTAGLASPMTWIWAVIDVCTVDRDCRGVRFES